MTWLECTSCTRIPWASWAGRAEGELYKSLKNTITLITICLCGIECREEVAARATGVLTQATYHTPPNQASTLFPDPASLIGQADDVTRFCVTVHQSIYNQGSSAQFVRAGTRGQGEEREWVKPRSAVLSDWTWWQRRWRCWRGREEST